MVLTDLKKNSTRSTKRALTVDEFIADAENYAMGQSQLKQPVAVDTPAAQSQLAAERGPMRHATFTLSQQAIDALNALSQQTGLPKSKLVRQLILQLDQNMSATPAAPVVVRKVE